MGAVKFSEIYITLHYITRDCMVKNGMVTMSMLWSRMLRNGMVCHCSWVVNSLI